MTAIRPALPGWFRRMASMAGPGYLVAVGYMDPGNWATDIAGGASFGYALLPVVVLANVAAVFLQRLSLRLGIVTGRDLALLCRDRYSRRTALGLWVTAEIAIIACDLAELIGAAIALKLLFGLPLILGIALTAADSLIILGLQRAGMRALDALVVGLTLLIAVCLGVELVWSAPALAGMASAFAPSRALVTNPHAAYLALGIFGATVMPHNLYLHSGLARARGLPVPQAIRWSTVDCVVALTLATLVNAAILILAAAAFHNTGHSTVADIEDAARLLAPLLGTANATVLFAVALLAAGQNATLTGTMAGQMVMEGFLDLKLPIALRRLLTRIVALVPALGVCWAAGDRGVSELLVLSQVVLSVQLPFAIVPLLRLTGDRALMGMHVNGRGMQWSGWALTVAIVAVNAWLVVTSLE